MKPGNTSSDIPYRLPAAHTDLSEGGYGGGFAEKVDSLHRPILSNRWWNMGLSMWKSFHYQDRPLPGTTYKAYEPPLSFSRWLR